MTFHNFAADAAFRVMKVTDSLNVNVQEDFIWNAWMKESHDFIITITLYVFSATNIIIRDKLVFY